LFSVSDNAKLVKSFGLAKCGGTFYVRRNVRHVECEGRKERLGGANMARREGEQCLVRKTIRKSQRY